MFSYNHPVSIFFSFFPRDHALQGDLVGGFLQSLGVCGGKAVGDAQLRCGFAEQGGVEGTHRQIGAVGIGVGVVISPQVIIQMLDGVGKGTVDVNAMSVFGLCGGGEMIVEKLALIEILYPARSLP